MATLERRKCVRTPTRAASPHAHWPSGESPYAQAKRAQARTLMVDKDPNKAVSLFWAAINNRDRVDSALKDMAMVMKQVSRPEEAIEAIKSFRGLCSSEAQYSLDNVLFDLYKKCGRIQDQIELLNRKLKLIDEGLVFGGRSVKTRKSRWKKLSYVSEGQEKARLLGNLAWAYMQLENYNDAELHYRRSLEIEPDNNRQSNLAICLMKTGRINEAKVLLQSIKESPIKCNTKSFTKSFKKASEMLKAIETKGECLNHTVQNANVCTSNLYFGMLSAWPVGRYQSEISSVSSSSSTPSEYVTPPSGFSKKRGVDRASHDQASVSIQNMSMVSNQEAFFTPESVNSCPKLKPKEQCSDQRSSDSIIENFESPARHRIRRYWKSRANHGKMEVPAEDTNLKPDLPAQSLTLSRNSSAKASQRSVVRQTQGRKKQGNSYDIWGKCNGRRRIYLEKEKCVIRDDTQMTEDLIQFQETPHDRETDSNFKNSINEKSDQSFETSGAGILRGNSKEITYTVWMTDNVDGAVKDLPIFSNGRRSFAGHSAKLDVLNPETPTTSTMTTIVSEKTKELNTGGSFTSSAWKSTPVSTTDIATPKSDFPLLNNRKKTWADMVEEEEEECTKSENEKIDAFKSSVAQFRWEESEAFAGEVMNLNTTLSSPDLKLLPSKNYKVMFDHKVESQSGRAIENRRNESARRSLSFDQHPFPKNRRHNRLRVFQEITSGYSPREC
ncbi:hypothetical protein J5N97_017716 [Dioscorea zingiberensis]|uniref:Uncharacterized protein n=1 Tax=Dioscorea zingiberensis TaxID=325984 RepID=A0A9D5HGH0_9LILI|nr:hypothetical protein J5N97_017716 [Dioscorea zingiberensis]